MPVGDLFTGPIPNEVLEQVTTKQNEIRELLQPYKVNITEDEKRHIPKAADETHPFLEKGLEYAESDPEYLSRTLDIDELNSDWNAHLDVARLERNGDIGQKLLTNIVITAGSDIFVAILDYYASARRAAKRGDARAKTIADELGKRFPGRPREEEEELSTEAPILN